MPLNIISLGAGVQSTTMALMAAHGEIEPMPDAAIFADTGWEPKAVYEHLDWLASPNVLPFPVYRVSAGNLRDKVMGEGYSDIPWYTPDGMGRRQCTKAFKLYPVRDKAKELLGISHGREAKPGAISMWVGISLDEVLRVKPAQVKYIENRWPLIEKRLRRWDCLQWMRRHGYPEPPRSACIGCPFRKNEEWRLLTAEEMQDAIEVDRAIRNARDVEQFMHRSLVPLEEADIRSDEDKGQMNFINECEGMCGV